MRHNKWDKSIWKPPLLPDMLQNIAQLPLPIACSTNSSAGHLRWTSSFDDFLMYINCMYTQCFISHGYIWLYQLRSWRWRFEHDMTTIRRCVYIYIYIASYCYICIFQFQYSQILENHLTSVSEHMPLVFTFNWCVPPGHSVFECAILAGSVSTWRV